MNLSSLYRPYVPDDADISSGQRPIVDGSRYDRYFPEPAQKDEVKLKNVEVDDTVALMERVVHTYIGDTKAIAPLLKKASLEETCKAIWDFLYHHIQYKLDIKGLEQLRRPARAWADKRTGIDCDCFSIFVSSILVNLQIPHSFRITKYSQPSWQHVYVVVPKENGQKGYYTIDPVLSSALYEKPFSQNFDYKMNLNGINVAVLSGVDDDYDQNIGGIDDMELAAIAIAGTDDELLGEFMEGLGELNGKRTSTNWGGSTVTPAAAPAAAPASFPYNAQSIVPYNPMQQVQMMPATPTAFKRGIPFNQLRNQNNGTKARKMRTWLNSMLRYATRYPELLRLGTPNPAIFLQNLRYLTQNFNVNAAAALGVVMVNEETENNLNGFYGDDNTISGIDDDMSLYGADDQLLLYADDSISGLLGKAKSKKAGKKKKGGFFRAIGKGAKFLAVKINPVAVAARNGFLLALKLNIGKMATKLKWAYATQEQARAKKVPDAHIQKARKALEKVEKLFVKKLQGNPKALRKAILSGKKGKLNGLGSLGVAPAGAALAAAVPIIAAVVKILKDSGLSNANEEIDVQQDINSATAGGGEMELYNDGSSEDYAAETGVTYGSEGEGDGEYMEGVGAIPGVSFLKNNPMMGAAIIGGAGLLIYTLTRKSRGGSTAPVSGLGGTCKKRKAAPKAQPKRKSKSSFTLR